LQKENTPSVNIIQDDVGLPLSVRLQEVFLYPVDQMIFVCPLDELMEKVRRK
jgi:hypothetical protein